MWQNPGLGLDPGLNSPELQSIDSLNEDQHAQNVKAWEKLPESDFSNASLAKELPQQSQTWVDEYSITKAFEIVRIFEKDSWSKLNLDKPEGMWFGSIAGRTDGPVNIKWITAFIKVLGIFFTMSNSDFLSLNWNFRIEKLAKRLESWKFRALSLKGKSMIINTLALSGLRYTGSVIPLPAWAEKRISRIIFDFLRSGKNKQIKCEVCCLPYELGGLKVVNVALKYKALLAKSVVFITDSQYKAKWVHLARYFIGHALGKLHESWGFLRSNIKPHAWEALSYYQSVASAAKDIKDVFITFVGKFLAVKVIYAELLIVSIVKVRSKILWQEKLGRTIPWSKIYLHSCKGFSTNQEHDVFLECCSTCLRQVSISAPGLVSISVWTVLSVRVSWRL